MKTVVLGDWLLCSQYKQIMVLKVFLIASSVQLLSVLGVAPRQTQSNILADLRTKHSLAEDKVTADDSPAHHDQSSVIENVLQQLFPGRIMVSGAQKDLKRECTYNCRVGS